MKITKRTHSARPPRVALQAKALENLKKFQAENRRTPNRSRERSELLPAAVKTGEITPTTAESALGRKGEFNYWRDKIGSEEAFKVELGKRASPTPQQIAEISKLEGDAQLKDRFEQGALDSKDFAKIARIAELPVEDVKQLINPPPPPSCTFPSLNPAPRSCPQIGQVERPSMNRSAQFRGGLERFPKRYQTRKNVWRIPDSTPHLVIDAMP